MTATISNCPPGRRWAAARPVRPAGPQPMCGRAAERQTVDTLLDRAAAGAGGVLLVDGEPGTGKSLLLREAERAAEGRGFSLATGAADQLGQTIPFFTLLTALRQPLTGCEPQQDEPGMRSRPGSVRCTRI